jgi:hypothetical protein
VAQLLMSLVVRDGQQAGMGKTNIQRLSVHTHANFGSGHHTHIVQHSSLNPTPAFAIIPHPALGTAQSLLAEGSEKRVEFQRPICTLMLPLGCFTATL